MPKKKLTELSNIEINNFFAGFPEFLGCFPKNTLPPLKSLAGYKSFIVNLNDAGQAGSHWVACILTPTKSFYVDPFGAPPPTQLQELLVAHNDAFFSDLVLQELTSSSCGYFCMYFIIQSLMRRPVLEILMNDFSNITKKNEAFLLKYFSRK